MPDTKVNYRLKLYKMKLPPIPPKKAITGHLSGFKNDPIQFMLNTTAEHGDIIMYQIFNKKIYMINHPDYVKHVLQSNHKNYHKSPGYRPLRLLGGMGIFTNDGEAWLRSRKFYQPAFNHQAIKSYFNVVQSNCQELIEHWNQNEQANASKEMSKITMNVICETLFSTRIPFGSDLWNDMTFALEWIGQRALRNPFVTPLWIPTKNNQQFKRSVENLNEVIFNIIKDKKKDNQHPNDLLSRFMNPEEQNLEGMSDQELRDEMMTIFIAGHESSANVLSWALYELAVHPEIQQKLFAEINALDWNNFEFEDIRQLPYCTQVLNEVMRLYPPLWHIGRMNLKDDEIGGYKIPAGSHIRMSPLVMQRSEKYWQNPNQFDPERFQEEKVKERNPFLHFPFGAGPRLCAGRNFAMMEMVVILAHIIKNFELHYSGIAPEMSPKMTLRSKADIIVQLKKR